MKILKSILPALLILAPSTGYTKYFKNSYISFEIPNSWKCNPSHLVWECVDTNSSARANESIIILAAKKANSTDTLSNYKKLLSQPKMLLRKGKTPKPSTVISVNAWTINEQIWVDATHENSEIQNFHTRYLATTKGSLSILITLTTHKKLQSKYNLMFSKVMNSLDIIAPPEMLENQVPQSTNSLAGPFNSEEGPARITSMFKSKKKIMLYIGGGLLLMFALLHLRPKKKTHRRSKK